MTTVQLTGDNLVDSSQIGVNGYVELVLSSDLVDTGDNTIVKACKVRAPVVNGVMSAVSLVPNDLLSPSTVYHVTHNFRGVPLRTYDIQLLVADGPSVDLSDKTPSVVSGPVVPPVTVVNVGTNGQILLSLGNGQAEWSDAAAASVSSVNGRDGAVVGLAEESDLEALIASLGSAAYVDTSAFDAAGSASAAQTAAESYSNGLVVAEQTRAEAAEATKLTASSNLSDLTSVTAARTALGLGSAALQSTSAFDAAGAAATAQSNAESFATTAVGVETSRAEAAEALLVPLSGGTMTGALAMGNHKITGLTNGSASSDAAAFGQIPVVASAGTAGAALAATDATTTNARTPTAHASSHASAGSDPITPDSIGATSADWADMLGLAILTAPLTDTGQTANSVAGNFVCSLAVAKKTKTITTLGIWVTTAGVTASGLNALAIYDSSGNYIDQTGDMSTAFASTGFVEGTLSGSHTLTAGQSYYLCAVTHFSGTVPKFAVTGTSSSANIPVCNGRYVAIYKAGITTIPEPSFTPSSYTLNSGQYVMYGR